MNIELMAQVLAGAIFEQNEIINSMFPECPRTETLEEIKQDLLTRIRSQLDTPDPLLLLI